MSILLHAQASWKQELTFVRPDAIIVGCSYTCLGLSYAVHVARSAASFGRVMQQSFRRPFAPAQIGLVIFVLVL